MELLQLVQLSQKLLTGKNLLLICRSDKNERGTHYTSYCSHTAVMKAMMQKDQQHFCALDIQNVEPVSETRFSNLLRCIPPVLSYLYSPFLLLHIKDYFQGSSTLYVQCQLTSLYLVLCNFGTSLIHRLP